MEESYQQLYQVHLYPLPIEEMDSVVFLLLRTYQDLQLNAFLLFDNFQSKVKHLLQQKCHYQQK